MTSKELNLFLLRLLPGIKDSYIEEVSWQDGHDTGSHVVFEDVLCPYIIRNAENEQELKHCFSTIETILLLHDEYAEEVILLSVLDDLLTEPEVIAKSLNYMGSETRRLLQELLKKRK